MNAQLVTSATGRYASTCRLCNKRGKEKDPLTDLGHLAKSVKMLTKHLEQDHLPEFQEGAELWGLTLDFLVLTAFDHEDPALDARAEWVRARIFAKVVDTTMQSLGLDPRDPKNINEAVKALLSQFAPTNQPSAVITPV